MVGDSQGPAGRGPSVGEETGPHAFVSQLHKHPKCTSSKEMGDGSSSECFMPGGGGVVASWPSSRTPEPSERPLSTHTPLHGQQAKNLPLRAALGPNAHGEAPDGATPEARPGL